jgi:protein-arginine kinase activator protein McsA
VTWATRGIPVAPKCEVCGNAATVHISMFGKGQQPDSHLCQACAEKQQLLQNQNLNLTAVLQRMVERSSDRKEPS